MRITLDTNILVFLLYGKDSLSTDVKEMLLDYSNTLYTSSVCVHELIHLCQIGKINKNSTEVLKDLQDVGISIQPISTKHLAEYAKLPLYDDHRDPNDRLVIAQAVSDRIPLVSSDHKFVKYEKHGLRFIFNER